MAPSSFARPYSADRSNSSPSSSVGRSPRSEFTMDVESWANRRQCAPSDTRSLRDLAGSAGYTSPSKQIKFHKSRTAPQSREERSQKSQATRGYSPESSQPRQSPGVDVDASPLKPAASRSNGEVRKPLPRQLFSDREGPSCSPEKAKSKVVGGGLSNLGNTCYMNATLQTLTHTPAFTERLCAHAEDGRRDPRHSAESCMLCILNEHVKMSFHSSGESFRPTVMHSNLTRIAKEFVPYRQEDAHEFLRLLLDACDIKESSIVDEVFGGKIRTMVTCCECSTISGTEDPVQDLSLEIDDADVDSANDALRKFTARETLEGENCYECEKCEKKVKAFKKIVLTAVPEITVIQLKRFKVINKITKFVSFKQKLLLEEVHGNKKRTVEGALYGVIVHAGITKSSGHYYAYVKGSDGKWRKFDDSSVFEVSWDEVMRSQAYMLFYKRVKSIEPTSSSRAEEQVPARSVLSNQVKRGVEACRQLWQRKKKKTTDAPSETNLTSALPKVMVNGKVDKPIEAAHTALSTNGHSTCDSRALSKKVEAESDVSSPGLKLVMAYE